MKHTLYFVYRCADRVDCSNNGLTNRVSQGYLFWDCNNDEAIAYCREHNINPNEQFILVDRTLWGEDHSYAEPLVKPEGSWAQTNGGNFISTSNGNCYKFKGETCGRPIPVHDRFDDWNTFNSMSI